jgi:protein-L-isoaspartate(D-aspartate) O-methyltransferase
MKTTALYVFFLIIALTGIKEKQNVQDMSFSESRVKMVAEQIKSRGITENKVISAMQIVERHLFVPGYLKKFAYQDRPLPIGYGQTISQPYIVGLMSQLLDVDKGDKLLEVGSGSGYQAAVLGELGGEVYSIEIVKPLQERAAFVLDSLGYKNVHIKYGDGYVGWPEKAPFDGIIVTCSPSRIPSALLEQLAEGGKLVIPVGEKDIKKLVLIEKKNGEITRKNIIPVRFVPMVDKRGNTY